MKCVKCVRSGNSNAKECKAVFEVYRRSRSAV